MSCERRLGGFTLVELVIVIVVVGIMSAYAAVKSASPTLATLPSQAQKMATDIRHMQVLATAWGRRLGLSVAGGANGTYSVSCAVSGAAPCNASPVVDPATGLGFSVSLQKNVVLAGSTLYVNSLGQPCDGSGAALSGATAYTLSYGGTTETLTVEAQSGRVTVSP